LKGKILFTGIVKGIFKIHEIRKLSGLMKVKVRLNTHFIENLQIGASIAINGVCLTVVQIDNIDVSFDIIEETLKITNLKYLDSNQEVNTERSAKFGDEIGGHILSGHIFGTCQMLQLFETDNNYAITLLTDPSIIKYIFRKGYIALDGVSLTVASIDNRKNIFTVHLIPETLRTTTFLQKRVGDVLNIEIDYNTQVLVDSITP
jgi:riboflavin synthase